MGDLKPVISELEGEENLIAAAQHIVQALGSKKNLTDDARRILVELGSKLSTMASLNDNKSEGVSEMEERLNIIHEKVMSWEADQSMIWDSGPEEASEYLKAVDEVQKLIGKLESRSFAKDSEEVELLQRSCDVLQTAMARLEEEFGYILVQNRQPFEPEHMSFRSSEDDIADEGSIVSFEDESVEDMRESVSRGSEEFIIDLVRPDVIPDLKCIANLMFVSNYDQECSQAFICVQKDALDECLCILEMEKLSIEDVLRMEWASLNSKIKRWVRAMKIFVRVYLASEKWLIDQIFGEVGSVNSACFIETSKSSMLRLLNFGEAVAISHHKPEKLFGIIDMYEVLTDLLPDMEALYPDEAGFCVRSEFQEVLNSLRNSVRATFLEFEKAIASNTSVNPFAGGGIHHLTRYVMNYIRNLTDYSVILNLLLDDHVPDNPISSSPHARPVLDGNRSDASCSVSVSPMAFHFQSLISILESNIDIKSKLYKDASLEHLFLMNNIHYMTQKVKDSELRAILGDEWIRKHNWKFQQHAMNYERATWSSILPLLKDEGIQNPNSNSVSKSLLKERLRSFYAAFEEVYKTQTGWLIPDLQLREDLRISASLKVVQAYRTFVGRHNSHITEKHIKYSADDLQNYILDLFEGSQRSLQSPHRR
ncbi:exocyst complex component EXO70E2 [Malania oleifera]|uniref:exocyst complex component EXO70E2 n=1 Tax=Malania oleifera TaxID=397392 RepID=UPI0025AECD69|nr:exocyst complex component EXO70E2 [Malania oleifera]XP_057964239.1 exocyst complex component EXO70E2 [Malania oleifera]